MKLATISKKLGELNRECKRLARKAEAGKLTEAEEKRKANELASRYLALSMKARYLIYEPHLSKYLENACFDQAVRLKRVAAKASSKPRKEYNKPRKGYNIQRKVITYPKMEGWQ